VGFDVRVSRGRTAAITGGGPTQDLTGDLGGGTPKLLILKATLGVTNGTEVNVAAISTGATDGTNFRCSCSTSDHSSTRTDCYRINSKDQTNKDLLTIIDGAGTVIARARFSSFAADKVTITWSTIPTTAIILDWTLVGGADFSCAVGSYDAPSLGGTRSVSGLSFAPSGVFSFGCGTDNFEASPTVKTTDSQIWWGFSAKSPAANVGVCQYIADNQTTSAVNSYLSQLYQSNHYTSSLLSAVYTSAWASDGFTVTEALGNNSGLPAAYVAMNCSGFFMRAGVDTTPSGTGVTEHTGPGMKPFWVTTFDSLCQAFDTGETDADAEAIGIGEVGTATASVVDGCMSFRTDDATNGSNSTVAKSLTDTKVVRLNNSASSPRLQADHDSFTASGFKRNYTTTNSVTRKFAWWAVGWSDGGGTGTGTVATQGNSSATSDVKGRSAGTTLQSSGGTSTAPTLGSTAGASVPRASATATAPSAGSTAGAESSTADSTSAGPTQGSVAGAAATSAAGLSTAGSGGSGGGTSGSEAGAAAVALSQGSVAGSVATAADALATAPTAGGSSGLALARAAIEAIADSLGSTAGFEYGYILDVGTLVVYLMGGTVYGQGTALAGPTAAAPTGGGAEGRALSIALLASLGDVVGTAAGRAEVQAIIHAVSDVRGFSAGQAQALGTIVQALTAGGGLARGLADLVALATASATTGGLSAGEADLWIREVVVPGLLQANGNSIRTRWATRVEALLSLPTQYDNAPPPSIPWPPISGPWAKLSVDIGQLEHRATGAGNLFRKRGELRGEIRYPIRAGDGAAMTAADGVVDVFRQVIAGGVNYGTPRITRRGRDRAWWLVEVACPFWDDVSVDALLSTAGAISGLADAASVIRTRFDSLVATPEALGVAWQNNPYTPSVGSEWAMLTILPGEQVVAEHVGAEFNYRTPGVLMVRLFVPIQAGDARLRELADVVVTNFRAVRDRGVLFRTPAAGAGSRQGAWWTVNVECPFVFEVIAA